MSGVILQPPTLPDADWGVLFYEVSGCLPMCGHGTIGTATVLVETGMVAVTEPVTTVRLDMPAGLVVADVHVSDGRATRVEFENVPAYCQALDLEVDVRGLGPVRYDLAWGPNFYVVTDSAQFGVTPDSENAGRLVALGTAIRDAVNDAARPVHVSEPHLGGCHAVIFTAPGRGDASVRTATSIRPGWIDRSPCGTGTSAQMAIRVARGEMAAGDTFVNENLIGSRFVGTVVGVTEVAGHVAVVPRVSGRAWIWAMGQYLLDANDPFPTGFELGA
jgi:proline racemase